MVETTRKVEPIDCSLELQWLKEHREQYVGHWIALDGDRLLANGPDAKEVYEKARSLGVRVPTVVRIEPWDELPFGGW